MTLLDGKVAAAHYMEKLKVEYNALKDHQPTLAVLHTGMTKEAEMYLRSIRSTAAALGVSVHQYQFFGHTPAEAVIKKVFDLNTNDNIHGIMILQPFAVLTITEAGASVYPTINIHKDVDACSSYNLSDIAYGNKATMYPCTPLGVMMLLEYYNIRISGKHVVVVGRSSVVGKPLFHMMNNRNATCTLCHSATRDIDHFTRDADIVVSAAGVPNLITGNSIKDGAVVVDVGTTIVGGKLYGDVDFNSVQDKASFVSPVPGGVGRMTQVALFQNLLTAVKSTVG